MKYLSFTASTRAQKTVLTIVAGGAITFLSGQSPTPIKPGDPLPGISAVQNALFLEGKDDFEEMEDVKDGLGPAFNGTSCVGCHNLPAVGGTGNGNVTRAGVLNGGVFTEPVGGSLIHLFSIGDGKCQPQVPRNANVMTRRIPTPLFGLGLIEAIPDEAIRQLAGRPTPDGIRGRAALVTDPVSGIQRVGRFGWKAQQATILAFAGDAYRNEMGITNDVFPQESATGFTAEQLAACDSVADPEDKRDPITGRRAIDRFTNFIALLAPPSPSGDPAMQQGAAVFQNVGCASCHLPQLQTGPNSNPVFDRKPVNAYSDFLLHDIRTGDGIQQGAANPTEFRTAPLWGLRYRKMLLHDGRALSPGQAIDMHDGDARPVRDRFRRLPPDQRQALLTFLDNL